MQTVQNVLVLLECVHQTVSVALILPFYRDVLYCCDTQWFRLCC